MTAFVKVSTDRLVMTRTAYLLLKWVKEESSIPTVLDDV